MAKFSAKALCALVVVCLAAGALAQDPPPPPSPYPPPPYPPPPSPYPPPPSPYPPSPPPASNSSLTGYARFFGPLSAGCAYKASDNTTGTTTLGGVSAMPNLMVTTTGACTDAFTGVAIPWAASGDSQSVGAFAISSTTSITYAASTIKPASFSYTQLGNLGTSKLDGLDLFAVLRAGNFTAWSMLSTDVKFIAVSQLLSQAYLTNGNFTGTGNNCTTTASVQAAIAKYYATTASPSPSSVLPAVLVSCNASSANISTILTSDVTTSLLRWQQLVPVLQSTPQALALPLFARIVSYLQTASLSSLISITNTTLVAAAANAAPIVPDQIATYLGLNPTTATSNTVNVQAVGALTGVSAVFWPFSNSSLVNTTLAATVTDSRQAFASTTNPAAYFGFYYVPEGAVDVLLSPDPTNTSTQVKTLAPFSGVVGFANASTLTGSATPLTVSPIIAIVNALWVAQQTTLVNTSNGVDLPAPTAVTSADFRAAYSKVLGGNASAIFGKEGQYNLMYRDFPVGSYSQAGVAVVDTLLPGLPGLGAFFLYKAANTTAYTYRDLTAWLYTATSSYSASSYSDPSVVSSILSKAWVRLGGILAPSSPPPPPVYPPPPAYPPPPPYPPPPARRRQLQAVPTVQSILDQVSIAVAASNALITDQIQTVATASAAGTAVNMTALYTRLAQVAAVQQTDLAAALANIAAAVASGNLTAALSLATQAASDFSGANLLAKVNAKTVNTAAINALSTNPSPPSPPPSTSDDSNKKSLALGLGLGLGLGIPLVIGAIAGIVYCVKARRAQQETAPAAATAESVFYGAAAVATQASTARLAEHFRTRVGPSTVV